MACWAQEYGGVRGQVHEGKSAWDCKCTRSQGYKSTRVQEHESTRKTRVQGYKCATWVQEHEGLRAQGCMKAQSCKDARAQEPKGIIAQGHKGVRMWGWKGVKVQGHEGIGVWECKSARCEVARAQDHRGTKPRPPSLNLSCGYVWLPSFKCKGMSAWECKRYEGQGHIENEGTRV